MISRRPLVHVLLPVLFLAGALLQGCASGLRDFREIEVRDVPFAVLWELSEESIRDGFGLQMDGAATDRGQRVLQSRWRVRHGGFEPSTRTRLRVEIESLGEQRGRDGDPGLDYVVRYYAEREQVGDVAKRLHPQEEDWSAAGQDGQMEQIFDYQLRARIARLKGEAAPRPIGGRSGDPFDEDKDR